MQRIRDVLRDRQYAYDEAQNMVATAEFWREEVEANELEMREDDLSPVRTPSIARNGLIHEYILLIMPASGGVVGRRRKRGYARTVEGAETDGVGAWECEHGSTGSRAGEGVWTDRSWAEMSVIAP